MRTKLKLIIGVACGSALGRMQLFALDLWQLVLGDTPIHGRV
jgi:hypothetical protein